MSTKESELRAVLAGTTSFLEVLDHLRARVGGDLGGVQLMAILQTEAGIHFTESRQMLAYFDPEWNPNVEREVIDERWGTIVENWLRGQ